MKSAVIIGSGVGLPDQIISNRDLEALMDTSEEWIESRSGIKERRLAEVGVGSSDLAAKACSEALTDAGIGPGDIDAIVVATMTPDTFAPGISAVVQDKVGLDHVPAFDIRQQCSGFLYGLDLADSLVRSNKAGRVLVVWSRGACRPPTVGRGLSESPVRRRNVARPLCPQHRTPRLECPVW